MAWGVRSSEWGSGLEEPPSVMTSLGTPSPALPAHLYITTVVSSFYHFALHSLACFFKTPFLLYF